MIDKGFKRRPAAILSAEKEATVADFEAIVRRGALILIWVMLIGCSDIPCQPPEYYAPEEGAPYLAEEVRVPTKAGHVLAGTLTIPRYVNQPLPGVVLITGSDPMNRDFTLAFVPEHYRPYREVADALSRRGIAVLRMDDRGYGCSGGGRVDSVTTAERADDIRAGVSYLKGREEINERQIGLIGWSEGAIIAPMIAVTDSSITAIVLMAGPATKGEVIIDFQDGTGWRGYSESLSEWHQFFMEYDPLPTAGRVKCPVLILHGDQDKHVPVEHANILAEAIRREGNQDVTVHIFPGHDHIFVYGGKEYLIEEAKKESIPIDEIPKISPEVVDIISDWIVNRLTF